MKILNIFYLSIYFALRTDKNWSKTERVKYLIDTVLFMLSSSVFLILFGMLKIRTDNLKTILILIFAVLITSHFASKIVLERGIELEYIQTGKSYDLKKKKFLAFLGILVFIISFVIMILSAIFMSYLWSVNLF